MPLGEGAAPRFDERMTDLEALMWGLERADPSLQTVMTLVGVLDRPVDPVDMLARLQSTCEAVPRLTELPDHGGLPMVAPRWVLDGSFDVTNHLRAAKIPGGSGVDALSGIVEGAMSDPFPAGHPAWDFTLVEGLDGGCGGFVARLHHSYTDGQGAVRIAMGLFDSPEDSRPVVSEPAPRLEAPEPFSAVERVLADVAHEVASSFSAARRLAPWATSALRQALANPGELTSRVDELVSSLARTARSAARPGSPLLAPRSGETHVAAVELGLEEMRIAGKNYGGTVNDVFLAGLAGGLALYHRELGVPFPAVKLGIPVSTRGDGDSLQNQLQGLLVRAPLNLDDPCERVRLMHAMVIETRQQAWLPLVDLGAAAALRFPFAPTVLAGLVRHTEVLASNLPGPPERLSLFGAKVRSLVPFGPRAGSALNLTLLSYAGDVAIGVNADTAAVSELGLFVECLRAGFDEVLA
jgi:diacylglycerol O-acyltransferase